MLFALCMSFMSCYKDNSSNQMNEPVLPEILEKGIIGSWSHPLYNGDTSTYVFYNDGTAVWHEQTQKGLVKVESLNYSYDEKTKKGLFLLNNNSIGLFFKYENNMILIYNQENFYTYFKRSNLKIELPKPIDPIVTPEPLKPEPPVISPKPEPLPIIAKWIRYNKDGTTQTYIFNSDGTYLWKTSYGREAKSTYTFNALRSFGTINVVGSKEIEFRYINGKIVFLGLFGTTSEFTKIL